MQGAQGFVCILKAPPPNMYPPFSRLHNLPFSLPNVHSFSTFSSCILVWKASGPVEPPRHYPAFWSPSPMSSCHVARARAGAANAHQKFEIFGGPRNPHDLRARNPQCTSPRNY
ncbi:hypothetical protein O6H91_20G030400 [Diphasiastrum complanatum]|uniref:Uncharacterized protein n=1 Tax=Diphasiastrum complanatum TaxID=34168 RepID=A0ACC2ANU5_DIPCM|nr:hypothetical protein O6H91_20G030400 [Diphasiastrum complanatum]